MLLLKVILYYSKCLNNVIFHNSFQIECKLIENYVDEVNEFLTFEKVQNANISI